MSENKLVIKTRRDSIDETIKSNRGGAVILYGMTYWNAQLLRMNLFDVDYVCDKKAITGFNDTILNMGGVPVVCNTQLGQIIGDKRATIIICVGINSSTINSIYKELIEYDFNADVFDYFDNDEIFSDKLFKYMNEDIPLYEHPYNCGYQNRRMTERSVELALAKKYICNHINIYEIGAVTPYYMYSDSILKIIDPTDSHKRVTKASLFDVDLKGKNVLSISTVEHIGKSDYGMHESFNVVDAINKILNESKSCLITAPYGYNKILDKWIKDNKSCDYLHFLSRKINNHWEEIDLSEWDYECSYTSLWADGLIVIEK